MTKHRLPVQEKYTKRQKLLTTIVEAIVNNDEDDSDLDTISICNIMEDQESQGNVRSESNATAIRALGETIRNTLLEISQVREQNRDRRHRELLDILQKVINSETKIVKKTQSCQTDNDIDCLKTAGTHCKVKVIETENTENKSSTSRIEDEKKTSSANHLKTQERPNTTAAEPKQNTEKIVAVKKDNKCVEDLKLMRANMMEMQRKKMEDRERKKRNCLEEKKH